MILIYTHQLNARIRYVFTHFFETYTKNNIEITDSLETVSLRIMGQSFHTQIKS